jgi:rubredoxin
LKIKIELLQSGFACDGAIQDAGMIINFAIGMIMSDYRKYQCGVCGHIYDEAEGGPGTGIAPGTRWEDIPDDWRCPECGVEKSEYALMD